MQKLRLRFSQISENSSQRGLLPVLKEIIYLRKGVLPVVKDIENFEPNGSRLAQMGAEIVHIDPDSYKTCEICPFEHPVQSRAEKYLSVIKAGYGILVLVANNKVLGDVWYVDSTVAHPDFKWLNFNLENKAVYLYDMYINNQIRGMGLGTLLLQSALEKFAQLGFTKAYGWIFVDNAPQISIHRKLGYQELKVIQVRRILMHTKAIGKSVNFRRR